MYWETKKPHVAHFLVVFALLWCPETKPILCLRSALPVIPLLLF